MFRILFPKYVATSPTRIAIVFRQERVVVQRTLTSAEDEQVVHDRVDDESCSSDEQEDRATLDVTYEERPYMRRIESEKRSFGPAPLAQLDRRGVVIDHQHERLER